MTQVVLKDSAGVNSKKSEYRYDGFSRKVVSKEYSWDANTAAWVKNEEVRRIYDGMDVVQERDDANAVKVNYTRSGNIGGLLSKTDATSGGTFFYHYDGSGNVTQMSDVNQAQVAEYSYDAYGQTLRAVGTQASDNRYRYSTKEWQTATGLYDYGYRFYSPSLGRWINRDPIREEGGLNMYGFVRNNPSTTVDSNGLIPQTIIEGAYNWLSGVDSLDFDCVLKSIDTAEAATWVSGLPGNGMGGGHRNGGLDGPGDAFKHCMLQCLISRCSSTRTAKIVGDTHEKVGWNGNDRERMDQHNNRQGRNSSCYNQSCGKSCIDRLYNNELIFFPPYALPITKPRFR